MIALYVEFIFRIWARNWFYMEMIIWHTMLFHKGEAKTQKRDETNSEVLILGFQGVLQETCVHLIIG